MQIPTRMNEQTGAIKKQKQEKNKKKLHSAPNQPNRLYVRSHQTTPLQIRRGKVELQCVALRLHSFPCTRRRYGDAFQRAFIPCVTKVTATSVCRRQISLSRTVVGIRRAFSQYGKFHYTRHKNRQIKYRKRWNRCEWSRDTQNNHIYVIFGTNAFAKQNNQMKLHPKQIHWIKSCACVCVFVHNERSKIQKKKKKKH